MLRCALCGWALPDGSKELTLAHYVPGLGMICHYCHAVGLEEKQA